MKRQANTLSALIQNFDTVEEAIEASAKSAGSALKENERYLDSIQGRIDQFNNALQSMWNNVLDDDLVKFIVQAGTELVKFIDNLGVVKTLVIGIGTYLIQKNFKGDLFGGLFNVQTVDEARDRLKNLQVDIAKLQKEGKNPKTIERKQNQASTLKASIDKYDELSKQLTKNRIDADAAKKALDDYNESLAKKYAKKKNQGKTPTAAETAEVERLQKAYDGANDEVIKTEVALKQAEVQAKATGTAGLNAGSKIKTGFISAGKAVWKFAKEMAMSMAYTMAFTAIFEAIGNIGEGLAPLFKNMDKSAEALQEKLSEFENELSSVESELGNLKSELKDTDERIEELMSQGSLTFVEQEELNKLKSVSAELKAQIGLQETLKKSKQQSVNGASIEATNAYLDTSFMSEKSKTESQEEAKEIGSGIGQIAGTIIGGIVGTIIGGGITLASGGTAAVPGAAIGIAAGSAIAGWIGGEAGSAIAGSSYDSEQTVGEAMDSMLETRAKLKADQDKTLAENDVEAYNEATEALRTYDTQMAKHISQIQQNYNAMDWEVADLETRKEMMEYADWLDKYNISMGTAGAKSNAVARMFGKEASDELKNIKADIEAAMNAAKVDGTDPAFDFQKVFNSEALSEFKKRLYDIGLTITDVEYYFLDLAKAEKEAEDSYTTYDTVKQINALSGGIKSLKDAFGEITEEGHVSTETLVSLEETFGGLGDSWENFVDTVATGTGSIQEATDAINELLEVYLLEKMAGGKMTAEEQLKTIMLLQQLGVKNAKEYIDAMQKASMVETIATNIVADKDGAKSYEQHIKDIEDLYDIDLTEDEERLLIEKAITAEKAKQEALEASTKQGEYKSAIYDQKVAQDKVNDLQSQIDYYLNNPEVWQRREIDGAYIGVAEHNKGATISAGVMNELVKPLQDQLKMAQDELDAIEIPAQVTEIDVENAEQAAEDAKNALGKVFDALGLSVDITLQDPSELVDDIQNVFDTLVNAQKEYSENGYLSVDTLQSLLQLEPKYLDLLVDEEGNLNLTKDALYNVARARIIDMGIQSQKNILESATKLAMEGSSEALREEISVMESANEAGTDFVSVQMAKVKAILAERVAAGELSQAEADAFVEGTMNQIEAVQVATQSALDNLHNSLSSSGNTATSEVEDAFQKAMDYWKNRIGANQSLYEQIQNDIDLVEKKGQIAGESYYDAQIAVENERLQHLKDQRVEALTYLDDFERGSEKWWEIANELNSIEGEIDDVTASLQDLNDARDQVHWTIFDEAHERIGDLTSQLSNVRDLLSADEDSFFNDEGEWTENGVAVLATHIQEIELYKNALSDVNDELDELDISDFDSEQEYYDKLTELTDKQYEYTKAISDSEQSVVDMYESSIDAVEEYTQELVENYNEYIDSVKEALDAERDLYDFKKNVQKQSKDIAAIERRIASLSGSTNAADIAERRKLEAELYDSRESLNDTYYDHAKQSQQEALDAEAQAYEETMTKFVEGLRTSLEQATLDMENFLMSVSAAVMLNADTVLDKYESTELLLSPALTNPWEKAKAATQNYSDGALALMNEWTKEGGFFETFKSHSADMESPFNAGKNAAQGFATDASKNMTSVYGSIQTNVRNSITELDKLKQKYKEINDEASRPPSSGGGGGGGGGGGEILLTGEDVSQLQQILNQFFSAKLQIDGVYGSATRSAVAHMQSWLSITPSGLYDQKTKDTMQKWLNQRNVGSWFRQVGFGIPGAMYAQGTTGTARDQWAITDEPQFGDELVLVPGKDGNLSFMRKGTGVVPADMTQKLFELAQIPTSDLMSKNLTAIVPNITKNDFKNEFNFESLVHVDTVDSDTLPKLEKMVDKKIDDFSKALNYSLKRFAR